MVVTLLSVFAIYTAERFEARERACFSSGP
jgi:hypothetical protein